MPAPRKAASALCALLFSACSFTATRVVFDPVAHAASCEVIAIAAGPSKVVVDWPDPASLGSGNQVNIGLVVPTKDSAPERAHCTSAEGGDSPDFMKLLFDLGTTLWALTPWG